MSWFALMQLRLPATVALAAIAALGYMVSRFRHRANGSEGFGLLDAVMLVLLMGIATAAGVPLVEAAAQGAKVVAIRENLRMIRTQIEAYKLQHGGEPPLLYQGALPQLTAATDARGNPGRHDKNHPYGPYFRAALPANPITGQYVVTATEKFPPVACSGNGGWLYHQKTGQIAIDLPEFLIE